MSLLHVNAGKCWKEPARASNKQVEARGQAQAKVPTPIFLQKYCSRSRQAVSSFSFLSVDFALVSFSSGLLRPIVQDSHYRDLLTCDSSEEKLKICRCRIKETKQSVSPFFVEEILEDNYGVKM